MTIRCPHCKSQDIVECWEGVMHFRANGRRGTMISWDKTSHYGYRCRKCNIDWENKQ